MASVRVCLLIALMISCVIVSSHAAAIERRDVDTAAETLLEAFKEQARREIVLEALKSRTTGAENSKKCFV